MEDTAYMPNIFKEAGKRVLDLTLIPALCYILDKTLDSRDRTIYNMARWKALESSLEYLETHMSNVCMLDSRLQLLNYALSRICLDGLCAEFGVHEGDSINYLAKRLPMIYGFDSFEGLKEDWKGVFAKGHFDRKGKLPRVAKNVRLVKGWFDESLPGFLEQHPGPFAFVHIDCDTYEATNTVLTLLGPRFVPGTVLVFDEYIGYRRWELGEFKAWKDYVDRTGTEYEYLAFTSPRVVIQVRSIP